MKTNLFRNRWFQRILSLVVIIVVWQILAQNVNPILFSPPTRVAARFYDLWTNGPLAFDTLVTIETIIISFVLSLIVGIPLGLVMGRIRPLEYGLDPYITLIYATPTIAVVPLMVIWFGSNLSSSFLLVMLHAVPPLIINTLVGVRVVSNTLVETGRSFGFEGVSLWRKVVLPASLPFVMAGIRIAIGAAVIGTMVAEIFLFTTGLGYILVYYAQTFDSAAVICGVLIVMALGIAFTELAKLLQRHLGKWSVTATGIK